MKLTQRQKEILRFVVHHESQEVKKSEIVDKFKHWYHNGADRYIGEILYRLVKRGRLVNHRHGYYSVWDNVSVYIKPEKDHAQLELFEE